MPHNLYIKRSDTGQTVVVNGVDRVFEAGFFQHDRNLAAIGCRPGVKINHLSRVSKVPGKAVAGARNYPPCVRDYLIISRANRSI